MNRWKRDKQSSKRQFRRTSGSKEVNWMVNPTRGGIRL